MTTAKMIVPDYDRHDLRMRGPVEVRTYLSDLLARAHREDAELVAIPRGWLADVLSILSSPLGGALMQGPDGDPGLMEQTRES